MIPTFVIGLREGLEAALIVGIIAAFLKKQGRGDLMGWLFAGVAAAIALCVAVGVALDVVSRDLPQRQQEGLETVIGVMAVGMVTYMVVWMRRHSRELKGQLEGLAADALAAPGTTAARALVVMAFLAVLREGFETVVFLLAAFNEAQSRSSAGIGAVLGIVIAVALGYGIYRGGVRINLGKFFRATGLVLVLVAAGLVVSAFHTAHEAGWLSFGQSRTVDLTALPIIGWLLKAGSVQASLLTGMLGIQPRPVLVEVVAWLLYLIPVGCYVAWPPGKAVPRHRLIPALTAVGAVSVVAALALALTAPSAPASGATTVAGSASARLVSATTTGAVVSTQLRSPASTANPVADGAREIRLRNGGLDRHAGFVTDMYTATLPGRAGEGLPATMSPERLSALDGGRLPLGVRAGGDTALPVRYQDTDTLTVWAVHSTGRIIDMRWNEQVNVAVVAKDLGAVPLGRPILTGDWRLPANARAAAEARARSDAAAVSDRSSRNVQVALLLTIGGLALVSALVLALTRKRVEEVPVEPVVTRIPTPV